MSNKIEKLEWVAPMRFVPKNKPILDKYGRILIGKAKLKKPPSKNDIEKDYPKQ